MAEIDSLDIKISSDASNANKAINSLVKNLDKLSSSLKFDTSGFENIQKISGNISKSIEQPIKKVAQSLTDLQKKYADLGKTFEFKGSTQEIQKQIDRYTNALEKAKLKKQELELSGKTEGQIYENAVKDTIKYINIIESLKNQLKEIQSIKPNIDFKISGIENVEKQITNVAEKIRTVSLSQSAFNYNADTMKAVFGEMASSIENWSQAIQQFGSNAGTVFNQAALNTENLKAETKDFEVALNSLKGITPQINETNIVKLQNRLKTVETQTEKLRYELEKGLRLGTIDDKAFDKLTIKIKESENQAELLKEKIKEVGNTSSQMSNGVRNFGDSIKSASNSILDMANSSTKAIRPLNNLGNSFRSLIRTILPILGIRQLFNWGKQATEIASDLTEVQNVVDVTFGNMAYKLEEFADTSIEKFGLSELSLKEYASRFQAMGTAMGFPTSQMSDMSVELTKLTADMASFYNVEQKAVAEDLQSIFTGTTMPLRQYGLDLTQATLQEWAMKQGLDADIKSMSQAEKMMLRYQYVLANTTAAQGDFARTANTWANQIRILKQNFQQLGSIIGGVLINAFKPFVQALNSVAQKVIQFAKTVANALGKIFGWKLEISSGGITDDIGGVADYADQAAGGLEDGADAAEDEADNLDKAQKAAKKLKDHTLGIDELNIVRPEDVDAIDDIADKLPNIKKPTSGAGGIGAGGAGDVSSNLTKTSSIFEDFKSDIDNLYELGEYIGKVLTDAMNSIDWDSVYEKARNFGKGLADFLNGLISPELFGALGRTIAGSLNTALHFLDSFGERFDWKDFGLSIATGINEFFATFDFALLAHTINTWAHGILDTIIEFIDKTDWNMIGTKIGEFLSDLDFVGVGKKVGEAIWKAINAGIDLWKGMFNATPFETILISLAAMPKLLSAIMSSKFVTGLKKLTDGFTLVSSAISGNQTALSLLMTQYPKFGKMMNVALQAFAEFKSGLNSQGLFEGFNQGISVVRNSLSGLQKGVITAIAGFAEFNIVSDVFENLTNGSQSLISAIAEIGATVAIAATAMYTAFGPAGLAIAGITAIIASIKGINDAMDELTHNIAMDAVAEAMQNPGGVPISEISNKYVEMANNIKEQFDGINQKSQELEITRGNIEETTNSLEPYVFAIQNGATVTDLSVTEMNNSFQRLLNESSTLLEQESLIIYQALAGSLGDAVVAAGGSIDEYILATDRLKTESQKQLEEISESLGKLKEDYENNILTQEEYANSMMDLINRYNELTGSGKEVESAVSNLNNIVSAGIDWSAVTYEDGTINVSALTNEIEKVGISFTDAKEIVSTSGQEVIDTINSLLEQAKATGDVESETALTQLLKYQEEEINRQIGEIDKLAGEYTQTIQDDLINKIPEMVQESVADWENLSGWEQNWIPKGEAADEAAQIFDSEYIQPAQKAIEESFGSLGEAGKTYASDAINLILDGMWEWDEATREAELTQNFESLVGNAIESSKENAIANAKEFGADTVKGLGTGILESIDLTKNPIDTLMKQVEAYIHNSNMDYGSPSKKAKEYGKWTVEGFNLGISENAESTKTSVTAWMESISEFFSKEVWAEKFNGIKDGFMTKWQEILEWFNSEFMPTWTEEGIMPWFSFEKWHDELLLNIPLAFQTMWEELLLWWNDEAMLVWWEESVMPWFEVDKWKLLLDNIRLAFVAEWAIIVKWWNEALEKWWKDNVLPKFTYEKWFNMLENVRRAFEQTWGIIKEKTNEKMEETYNVVRSWCDEMLSAIAEVASAIDGVIAKLNSISSMGISLGVSGFATGGFPDTGQIFLAREAGAEMVGSIGGHTAVANNDQIVESISCGVRQAVVEVLAPYLADIAQNTRETADKDMSVTLGDEDIALSNRRGEARLGFNFGG